MPYLCTYKMNDHSDILEIAYKQPLMQNQMQLLMHKEKQIPGSVNYSIKRFAKETQWNIDDTGMLIYHTEKNNHTEDYIQLKFCVSGNVYCREKKTECDFCKFNSSKTCVEKVDSVDVLSFTFSPSYLKPKLIAYCSSIMEMNTSACYKKGWRKKLPALCIAVKSMNLL